MTLDQYFAALIEQVLLLTFLAAGIMVATVGAIVFLLAGAVSCLRGRSNCMFYAWARYWRFGDWVLMIPSQYGWWPHWRVSRDHGLTWQEYVPIGRKRKRLIPPIVFTGEVRDVSL